MKITSQPLTFLDTTDSRKLEVYISSNHPTVQLYNQNNQNNKYTPDWSTTNLKLTADIFLDSDEITPQKKKWYRQSINETSETLISTGDYTDEIIISANMTSAIVTYICRVEYQGLTAFAKITFAKTDAGINGVNGKDGTSVRILGTATAANRVDDTDYYTITYSNSAITAAELGDAYLFNGELYVCAVKLDADDHFINVGRIQGPAGKDGVDAKLITLSSSAHVFKVENAGTVTPATITVTATTINTSVSDWSYSTDGGKNFDSTKVPSGLSRNGNTITITGATFDNNSVVIKASDGIYSDTLTVYKVSDGAKGDSASMAFLTNENISLTANHSGQVSLTALTTNVVAYNGTEKVMPTVGTPSGMPSGMTVSVDSTSLASSSKEAIITISIANNATLGSASSNNGTITIPITSPVSTNLSLSWSKINTGATGRGISNIMEYYLATTASSGVATTTSGWSTTIQTIDATKKYLWNYELITYTDSTTSTTTPVIIGVFGNTGSAGKGIKSITEYYLATSASSGVTTSSTGWTTTIQTITETNKYLWNYELITYTDNTTTTINPVIIGVYGATGLPGTPGTDAVTFQIYSSNGYALSINTPSVTLQTFAYVGDVAITAGATYQWYSYSASGWSAISNATNAYLTISRDDVAFSKSYMCKMTFNGVVYSSVATVDDKNDNNKVFTNKPSNYAAGDLWIVGVDYAPSGVEVGTLLRAEHTNTTYADADWITATKYDKQLADLQNNLVQYNQHFSFDSTNGVKITAKDSNGVESKYSTTITNDEWAINYGSDAVTYVNGTKMHIKEAEVESPLTITGKYSGSTMLQAPIMNIGNFSLVIESNGSLSIVVKT